MDGRTKSSRALLALSAGKHVNILHYNWHWFRNWGTGEAGHNGVHALDLCRWGIGVEMPVRVTAAGDRYHRDDDWEFPDTQVLSFEFPGGESATWEGLRCDQMPVRGSGFGASLHGRDGSLVMEGNGYALYDYRYWTPSSRTSRISSSSSS